MDKIHMESLVTIFMVGVLIVLFITLPLVGITYNHSAIISILVFIIGISGFSIKVILKN
ncbi:MAG: hypothetical protein LRZ92_05035 [Methanosarcinaceae archaeon]|nr:hypothetical protein [Methanosarcinaceae archaeon]NKQ38263.1 hypothetical protein [Methanosarcinales archaeon]